MGKLKQAASTCSKSQHESVLGLGPEPPLPLLFQGSLAMALLPTVCLLSTLPPNIHFSGLIRLTLLFGSTYFNKHIDYSYIKGA
jgi:hypothetical protein